MIAFSYLSLLSQKYQVSNLEEDAKFFELLKIIEDCPLVVQKTFPVIPGAFSVLRGNPESQRGKVLELRIVEV